MGKLSTKDARFLRRSRIRKKISGTAARPRLSVYRGNRNIYSQLIDDNTGVTIVSASTKSPEISGKVKGANVAAAQEVGTLLAQKAKEKGIGQIVFDRGGYKYHGKVKALAEAARAAGLDF